MKGRASFYLAASLLILGMFLAACTRDLAQEEVWPIQPGMTQKEVTGQIGVPDESAELDGYLVYQYLNRPDLGGWQRIVLWFELEGNRQEVKIVFLGDAPYDREKRLPLSTVNTLSVLVDKVGRPDDVFWRSCWSRFLVWTAEGIGASVSADPDVENQTGKEIRVYDLLLFSPDYESRIDIGPWTREFVPPQSENLCVSPGTDSPDTNPQDPYNWELILSEEVEVGVMTLEDDAS